MSELNKIQFSTERMYLRVLNEKVYSELYKTKEDLFIMNYLGLNSIEELEIEKEKYKLGLTAYDRTFEVFQMIDKLSGKLIGMTGFVRIWHKHRRAEIGYALYDKVFEGKGYTSEATIPLIKYGFTKLNLNRIEAIVAPENTASLKIIEKLGMQKEGHLKQHYMSNGAAEDSIIFGILKPS